VTTAARVVATAWTGAGEPGYSKTWRYLAFSADRPRAQVRGNRVLSGEMRIAAPTAFSVMNSRPITDEMSME
jgi:hypothetical protein